MSTEKGLQKQRERQFGGFGVIYQPGNVPNNPIKEFDEIYLKDERKVALNSLEKFSQDQSFNDQIEKLKPEIRNLPECKCLLTIAEHGKCQLVIKDYHSQQGTIDKSQVIARLKEIIEKANQQKFMPKQAIKPQNFRTVPCRNFHGGPTGC